MHERAQLPQRIYSTAGLMIREGRGSTDIESFNGVFWAASNDEARGLQVAAMLKKYPTHGVRWVDVIEIPASMIEKAWLAAQPQEEGSSDAG